MVAVWVREIDGNYAYFESDGTDLVQGRGSIEFDGGRLTSFATDASREQCLFIVEDPSDGLTYLKTRACRGDGEPELLPGNYTAAAW